MHEIGRIKRIQVQRIPLKRRNKPTRFYDPSPLLEVEMLLLSAKGIIGVTGDGREIMDAHHMDHPESRNVEGMNNISFGFASHYRSMREHFGDHLTDGIAGENVLVETEVMWQREDLGEMLALQNYTTGTIFYLRDILVAAPCIEFTQYAANHGLALPPQVLKESLQFLDHGMRGFYAAITHPDDLITIQAGDKVFAVHT
jgi:hypothetical protein